MASTSSSQGVSPSFWRARARILRFSQREIATLLGISREWVGQELIKWREAGYIELRRSRLIVRNKPALERIIASGDSMTSNY